MADSALSSDPLERYGAIERSYCEERWMAVIHDGQTLLGDLGRADEPSPEGLKERLQLLIGHAFLYGLGDRDSAEDLYQAVLRSDAEPSLRQIAEQGLQQCALPIEPVETGEQPLELQDSPSGLDASAAAAASVWQEAGSDVSAAIPATAPASESTAARQEPSSAQQPRQDSWAATDQPASSEPGGTADWLSAAAPAAPQDSTAQPVMPWLQAAETAAATGPVVPLQSEQVGDGLGQAAASLPAQQVEPWGAPFLAPTQEETALSPETAASLQATASGIAAAFQQLSGGQQGDIAPVRPEPLDGSGESADTRLEEPNDRNAVAALPVSPLPGAETQGLLADVVDEPELIELYEAASRGDEVVLRPADADPQASLSLAKPDQATAESSSAEATDPGQTARPERRGAEPDAGDPQRDGLVQPLDGPEPEPAAVASAPPTEVDAPVPFSVNTPAVASGSGPFSAPPEPVAEEDPELLMGLLKVEMG